MQLKELLKYIIISLIQGFTEPLPISSSGHMLITKNLLKIKSNDLTLEIFLNFASMIAIFLFMFTKRLSFKETFFNLSMIKKLIIASIPTIIIGFFVKSYIEKTNLSVTYIAISLLVTSALLILSFVLIDKTKSNKITNFNALSLGFSQSIALIPGISRMGTVMTCGLIGGIKIKKILDFSFLMYLVVSVGSFVLSLPSLSTINSTLTAYYIISFIVTFITTYFSISWFYNIISKKSLIGFSLYTFLLGLIIFIIG